MGCLLCYEEYSVQGFGPSPRRSVGTQTSRHTDPDACIQSRQNPFDTYKTFAPENITIDKTCGHLGLKIFEKVDNGIHLLQRGISIAQGAYQIGRVAAPYVAAML